MHSIEAFQLTFIKCMITHGVHMTKMEAAAESLWYRFKKMEILEMLWTAVILILLFFSEAFWEPQSISGDAGRCV